MIKFLRLENDGLLNVDVVKGMRKNVYLTKRDHPEGNRRGIKAEIELLGAAGAMYELVDVRVYAQLEEGELWDYDTEGGKRAVRRIEDILDTMLVLLVDKMNDEDEKIISIDTRFLEEAMQEEVDRG